MADAGSFDAKANVTLAVALDGKGLQELSNTIKEISKGKDLQRYWKDVESATDSAAKAIERYNKNVNSKGLAENLLKQINALKALTKKENLSELFPNMELNLDELVESAKKIVPQISSQFSVDSFSQAFKTFDLLKEKSIDLTEAFRKLADYADLVSRNSELSRENSQFRELIGDSDVEEVKSKLSEIKRLRDQAEEIFTSFLKVNNVERTDYWGDEKFSDYFDAIRKGSLTATEAISRFKTEYAYLLEEGFKSNNDTFGLEQLQAFSNKLDSIFRQVEETSAKINDIISNGVITKSVENLSMDSSLSDSQRSLFGNLLQDEESLKSITTLFQKLIEESNKTSKVDLFNDEQLQQVLSIFDKIESHLSSLRSIISDVGDGEEFSPLLKAINDIKEATSNIKLNFNMDLGDEVSERLNQKVSQASARQLEAYRKLFSAMKGTGKTNKEMLKFFEPDEASVTELIGTYKGIIERAEKQFKVGNSNIYKKYLGAEYDSLKREITNANKQLSRADSKRSENGILGDLFGNTKDLSSVIEQLSKIIEKLDEISKSALEFKSTFKEGFNVTASVEEIDKLTNRVKELEDELSKIKLNPVNVDKSNISSENITNQIVENEKKKQEAYKATADAVMYHAGVVSELNKAETNGRFYGSNRDTGYFGTGHYFVDSATKHELDNNSSYSKLPYTSIDISQYDNLFKATTDEIAGGLHTFLKNLTKFTQGSDSFDVSELFSQFQKVFGETAMDMQEFDATLEKLKVFMQNSSMEDRSDSVSTQFMKSLGYGGVDTRGTRYADTRYGTVIYDLKEESILQANITDELQKQGQMLEKINYEKGQVFDQNEDTRIQGIIDEQNKVKEIQSEFEKLYDTTQLRAYESELDSIDDKLSENKKIIDNCRSGIETADEDARRFAKDFADMFDEEMISDDEIKENADRSRLEYQERISELEEENQLLLARKSELEANIESEAKLVNAARERAKAIVEERNKPIEDVFQGGIEEKSIDTLKAKIKEIFTDTDELKRVLKSLDEGSYFHLDWYKDSELKDFTDVDERIGKLIPLLKEYGYTIKNLNSSSDSLETSGSIVSLADENDKLEKITTSAKEAATSKEKFANANKEVKASADETVISVDKEISALEKAGSKFESQAAGLAIKPDDQHQFSSWKNDLNELNAKIDEYKSKVENLSKIDIADEEQIKKSKTEIENLGKSIKETINVMTKTPQTKRGWTDIGASKAAEKVANVLKQNTKMSKEAKDAIRAYYNELRSGNPSQPIDEILVKVNQLVQKERELGRVGKSFGEIFKEKVIYGGAAQLAGMVGFYDVINVIRQAGEAVIDLNTNITELAKVSEASASQIYDDFNSYADIAKEVGGTISDTISATADWSRNGYNIPDAKELAEVAMIYKNVGDGIDINQANEYLISTLRGFSLEAKDAMDIIDSINEVANNDPISSAGIGEALQRSAAAFNVANTSLQESIALVTSTNSVLQSPEKVGSMWTTVSARIRGAKTELEDAGLETDGMVESTSKLQAMIKGMTGFDILEDDQKTFKSIYDIIIGIGEEFQNLSGVDQAALLEALAGGIILPENMETYLMNIFNCKVNLKLYATI